MLPQGNSLQCSRKLYAARPLYTILYVLSSMLDYILYQYTPGGQFSYGENDSQASGELLGVVAKEQGVFEVKGKGEKPGIGSYLLLPVKGSRQLSLKMEVKAVSPLITPVGAWSATCDGPKQREFNLKNIQACCDECKENSELEFISFSGDDQTDAVAAMNLAGWKATLQRQVCPKCTGNEG